MNLLQPDGLLRIPRQDLTRLELIHLVSGLDDDTGAESERQCGASTAWSGYTEWACAQEPRLSLGWDWVLDSGSMSPRVRRLGLPRTNLLLLDDGCTALPWSESLYVLATFIDAYDWDTLVFRAVCERYTA